MSLDELARRLFNTWLIASSIILKSGAWELLDDSDRAPWLAVARDVLLLHKTGALN